jgi:hypothetical protein
MPLVTLEQVVGHRERHHNRQIGEMEAAQGAAKMTGLDVLDDQSQDGEADHGGEHPAQAGEVPGGSWVCHLLKPTIAASATLPSRSLATALATSLVVPLYSGKLGADRPRA